MRGWAWLLLLLGACLAGGQEPQSGPHLPSPTLSGYLPLNKTDGSALFFTYYEAQHHHHTSTAPILVWLQGGPGCASSFGNLYELGPMLVTPSLELEPNPGAWNRKAALLFIDQPVGTGFSVAGSHGIPEDEMEMAEDLYTGLQRFFKQHPHLRHRPLVIAGESYAGKYVPSIGHFILQQQERQQQERQQQRQLAANGSPSAAQSAPPLRRTRQVPEGLLQGREELHQAPLFHLAGLVIGNGLTDPAAQVGTHANVAHAMGLLDERQAVEARSMQAHVQELIAAGKWRQAHELRGQLLSYLGNAAGAATLLDVTRYEEYDADKTVDRYLNQRHVKEALGVPPFLRFESCSERVGKVLGADVMKSVADLVPDLLAALPMLLFQGHHDIQDGPPSTEAWVNRLDWPGRDPFFNASRRIVRVADIQGCPPAVPLSPEGLNTQAQPPQLTGGAAGVQQEAGAAAASAAARRRLAAAGEPTEADQDGQRMSCRAVAAYWKAHGPLTHVVVRGAGHMVPRDAPRTAQYMIERWLEEVVGKEWGVMQG